MTGTDIYDLVARRGPVHDQLQADIYAIGLELDPTTALERVRARTSSVVAGMRKKVADNIRRDALRPPRRSDPVQLPVF